MKIHEVTTVVVGVVLLLGLAIGVFPMDGTGKKLTDAISAHEKNKATFSKLMNEHADMFTILREGGTHYNSEFEMDVLDEKWAAAAIMVPWIEWEQ